MQKTRDIIVIGASAGGVEALRQLVGGLPPSFPAAIFIVLHRPAEGGSLLASILSRVGGLPAADAQQDQLWEPGRIYIAPPDHHLFLEGPRLRLTHGPKENYARPAIDPLFRSAAQGFGERVIGVVLSGTLYDGAGGLYTIKKHGGVTIVQHPNDAAFSGMPLNALSRVDADFVLPLGDIPAVLQRLTSVSLSPFDIKGDDMTVPPFSANTSTLRDSDDTPSATTEFEGLPAVIRGNQDEQASGERHGRASLFTCPDCGGTLWQADAGRLTQFRCHIGHVVTAEALADGQKDAIEHSLWYAIRTMSDRTLLLRQLAQRSRDSGDTASAERFESQAQTAEQHKETLRRIVEKDG